MGMSSCCRRESYCGQASSASTAAGFCLPHTACKRGQSDPSLRQVWCPLHCHWANASTNSSDMKPKTRGWSTSSAPSTSRTAQRGDAAGSELVPNAAPSHTDQRFLKLARLTASGFMLSVPVLFNTLSSSTAGRAGERRSAPFEEECLHPWCLSQDWFCDGRHRESDVDTSHDSRLQQQ